MSFFRHREIFRSDVMRSTEEQRNRNRCSPAHRLDEFPVGYSSASCTPAALASASPTGIHSATKARCRHRIFQPTANSVLTFCVTSGDNRIAIPSDLNALMKTDAPPVMVKPRSGTDFALGWQKTVEKYKYDRLNQPWDDRNMVEITPPT